MLGVDVSRHGEARLQDVVGVVLWSLEELLKVLVLWHFLVARLLPLCNGLRKKKKKTVSQSAVLCLSRMEAEGEGPTSPW